MQPMIDLLEVMGDAALRELEGMADLVALDGWRVRYLGRKGELASLMSRLGGLPPEEKKAFGQAANAWKERLNQAYEGRLLALKDAAETGRLLADRVDHTLPGPPFGAGNLHVITKTLRRIYGIFAQMGFQILESPEVETDEFNFGMLNMPEDHPAREMWDTFYLTDPGLLLRTHTSPGQIWAMRKYHPGPIRVILPGKVYRYEAVTARSEFMFHQVEGLAVGERITMADLKGILVSFARQLFGPERQVRLRCSYFPFTEPSVEVDMDCMLCAGRGCRICKGSGWLEIAGAGMVHPQVLRNGGYDPERFTGLAFGMGPERITMLIHGIDDIRWFFGNDLRFLRQF
jgi:phenylalanyl-tRNA synthetase alpha chain